jgi:hypothetical protein
VAASDSSAIKLAVVRGQREDMLGAHRDGGLEVVGRRCGTDKQNDPAAKAAALGARSVGRDHVEQDGHKVWTAGRLDGSGACTTGNPAATATRSTSSRSAGSPTSARIPLLAFTTSACGRVTTQRHRRYGVCG